MGFRKFFGLGRKKGADEEPDRRSAGEKAADVRTLKMGGSVTVGGVSRALQATVLESEQSYGVNPDGTVTDDVAELLGASRRRLSNWTGAEDPREAAGNPLDGVDTRNVGDDKSAITAMASESPEVTGARRLMHGIAMCEQILRQHGCVRRFDKFTGSTQVAIAIQLITMPQESTEPDKYAELLVIVGILEKDEGGTHKIVSKLQTAVGATGTVIETGEQDVILEKTYKLSARYAVQTFDLNIKLNDHLVDWVNALLTPIFKTTERNTIITELQKELNQVSPNLPLILAVLGNGFVNGKLLSTIHLDYIKLALGDKPDESWMEVLKVDSDDQYEIDGKKAWFKERGTNEIDLSELSAQGSASQELMAVLTATGGIATLDEDLPHIGGVGGGTTRNIKTIEES